jgi:hypothetical protein
MRVAQAWVSRPPDHSEVYEFDPPPPALLQPLQGRSGKSRKTTIFSPRLKLASPKKRTACQFLCGAIKGETACPVTDIGFIEWESAERGLADNLCARVFKNKYKHMKTRQAQRELMVKNRFADMTTLRHAAHLHSELLIFWVLVRFGFHLPRAPVGPLYAWLGRQTFAISTAIIYGFGAQAKCTVDPPCYSRAHYWLCVVLVRIIFMRAYRV